MADGGTIFLDEIGTISQKMQVQLLRVIESKQFMRVAETKSFTAISELFAQRIATSKKQ